ncbi:alpha/beta hydrolase family protein [Colwellia sp. MEBiC06753]
MTISPEDITISCQDGVKLAASLYCPSSPVVGAVMIGPATGIKRQFYHYFALYLAEQGYGVITFDNRGIGQSLVGDISKCEVNLQSWGELDMPAVLSELQQRFPDTLYHLVGHSAGGQLLGLMANCQELTSVFNYACSSGQLRNMPAPYQIKAHIFMNIFIPLSNLLFGHVKSQWLGMGEPLPKNVAAQWRQWCNGQGYAKTAFGKTIHRHWYHEIDVPSLWVNASDDEIAINDNVEDMVSVFSQIRERRLTLLPEQFNLPEIGHMKFFSRRASNLWQFASDWFEQFNAAGRK